MKFGLLTEGQVNKGMSYGVRLRESLDECVFAEQMGFDFVGTSEQHFMGSSYTVSAPDVFYGALAERTSTIKLRRMAVASLGFNHPVRVAENIAMLDILSKGRVEVGTARSNNSKYLAAFGVDPATTREEWREHLEVMVRALRQDQFDFQGEFYQVALEEGIVPKLESRECPPLWVSATSVASHVNAGKLGIGVFTADNFLGWDYQNSLIEAYRQGIAEAAPIDDLYEVNDRVSLLAFPAYCGATKQEALDVAGATVGGLLSSVHEMSKGLVDTGSGDYQYWQAFRDNIDAHGDDLEYMIDSTPMLMLGTPDDFIARCHKLEEMGVDEVILKIDGYGHSKTMRSIEMIGKYVIPTFNTSPGSIPVNDWEAHGVPQGNYEL